MPTTKVTYLLLVHGVIISYIAITLVSSNPTLNGQAIRNLLTVNGDSHHLRGKKSSGSNLFSNSMKGIKSSRNIPIDHSHPLHQMNSVRLNANRNSETKENNNHNNIDSGYAKTEYQRQLIEQVKKEILEKLRMTTPPNVTIPKSTLPKPLQYGELDLADDFSRQEKDPSDDYYGRTERIILFAENVEYPICKGPTHNPEACLDFKITKEILNHEISSAEFWVYKLRDKRDTYNQTFTVTEVPSRNSHFGRHNVVAIRETTIKNGWLKFDLTNTIRRWLTKHPSEVQGLKISCNTCVMDVNDIPISNEQSEKPFIIINFRNQESIKRSKRNSFCQPGATECCKEPLTINFKDIGWSNWIIMPESYQANYCQGSCASNGFIYEDQYLTFYELHRVNMNPKNKGLTAPCCVSKSTKPLLILYWDNGAAVEQYLPNMIVDSCGCRR